MVFPLLFLFRPSMDWMVSSHRGKGNLLTQSTDLNAHLIQKHLEDTLTNNVFLASLSYLGSCRLTPKINHHLRLSLLVMVLSMTSTPAKENIPTHGLWWWGSHICYFYYPHHYLQMTLAGPGWHLCPKVVNTRTNWWPWIIMRIKPSGQRKWSSHQKNKYQEAKTMNKIRWRKKKKNALDLQHQE